ncbi:MAG TPA: SpoVA/SpoVAEb family sporulation membrane protein [Clostridiales bacterium]|nr:SpoVA/SpoVAEb family sporulation membrane protein [Clostridiales bacterium]
MENKEYLKTVRKEMPKSKHALTMVRAFLTGGLICVIGQAIFDTLKYFMPLVVEEMIHQYTITILILITGILTGIGVYDKIGKFGGAGSIISITGFANSVVAPAIEHKREGYILGLCANMFTIAGPVIVLGIAASVIVGILAMIFPGLFLR